MQSKAASAKARIERLIQFFTRDNAPDLIHYISGINEPDARSIDDGNNYGDPLRNSRPDFIQKELTGWE